MTLASKSECKSSSVLCLKALNNTSISLFFIVESSYELFNFCNILTCCNKDIYIF